MVHFKTELSAIYVSVTGIFVSKHSLKSVNLKSFTHTPNKCLLMESMLLNFNKISGYIVRIMQPRPIRLLSTHIN